MINQSQACKKFVSPLSMQQLFTSEVSNNFFSLHVSPHAHNSLIYMQVISPIVNTSQLRNTYKILQTKLPTIHSSLCFNDQNLPFFKEVRHTEIGHLFEHILLEYIYQIKTTKGNKNISVKGETSWNWYKNPTGFFQIRINIGSSEKEILFQALSPSIELLLFIFLSHQDYQVGVKSHPLPRKNFTPAQLPRFFDVLKE